MRGEVPVAREQRRLAAIVSADVAGYSRLMGRDESGTLAALKTVRRELIDSKITEYCGRIVKTTGDGLLLEFPSVVDAVRCVIDILAAMVTHNADVPSDRRIEVRVGVNIGDIIVDGNDIFGDGVNAAARLQELAVPGSGNVRFWRVDRTYDGHHESDANEGIPARNLLLAQNCPSTRGPLALQDKHIPQHTTPRLCWKRQPR
jgi:class 3 adenylate cyclase